MGLSQYTLSQFIDDDPRNPTMELLYSSGGMKNCAVGTIHSPWMPTIPTPTPVAVGGRYVLLSCAIDKAQIACNTSAAQWLQFQEQIAPSKVGSINPAFVEWTNEMFFVTEMLASFDSFAAYSTFSMTHEGTTQCLYNVLLNVCSCRNT